ncbi:MAG: hypothetical protein JWM27_1137 [Gemmatimonadetes bacterium]|nr:hypothetical protein [Gemmatimonadota bacterium]
MRGRDPHLNLRIGLFFVAAVLLLIGEVADRRAYAIPAVVVAIAALLLRFFAPGAEDPGDSAPDPDGMDERTE